VTDKSDSSEKTQSYEDESYTAFAFLASIIRLYSQLSTIRKPQTKVPAKVNTESPIQLSGMLNALQINIANVKNCAGSYRAELLKLKR
jgi:hypothetical protein